MLRAPWISYSITLPPLFCLVGTMDPSYNCETKPKPAVCRLNGWMPLLTAEAQTNRASPGDLHGVGLWDGCSQWVDLSSSNAHAHIACAELPHHAMMGTLCTVAERGPENRARVHLKTCSSVRFMCTRLRRASGGGTTRAKHEVDCCLIGAQHVPFPSSELHSHSWFRG